MCLLHTESGWGGFLVRPPSTGPSEAPHFCQQSSCEATRWWPQLAFPRPCEGERPLALAQLLRTCSSESAQLQNRVAEKQLHWAVRLFR